MKTFWKSRSRDSHILKSSSFQCETKHRFYTQIIQSLPPKPEVGTNSDNKNKKGDLIRFYRNKLQVAWAVEWGYLSIWTSTTTSRLYFLNNYVNFVSWKFMSHLHFLSFVTWKIYVVNNYHRNRKIKTEVVWPGYNALLIATLNIPETNTQCTHLYL